MKFLFGNKLLGKNKRTFLDPPKKWSINFVPLLEGSSYHDNNNHRNTNNHNNKNNHNKNHKSNDNHKNNHNDNIWYR